MYNLKKKKNYKLKILILFINLKTIIKKIIIIKNKK